MSKHPFIEALLERVTALPSMSSGTVQQGRAAIAAGRAALGPGPVMHESKELLLTTRSGAIASRIHIPSPNPKGVVIYLHGGGWALGSIDDFDVLGRAFAACSACAVVLPEYRLAPEHPYPSALNDAEDAIRDIAMRRNDLFGSQLPIVVAGDSAGANLATVAARKLREEVALALQVLIYPVTDCDTDTASYREHATGLILTRDDMAWFLNLYTSPENWPDPDISPLRAHDLAGSPPALVVTAEYDVLASEGAAYAQRLNQSGVPTEHRVVAGVTHGFIRLHNLFDVAQSELDAIGKAVSAACERMVI